MELQIALRNGSNGVGRKKSNGQGATCLESAGDDDQERVSGCRRATQVPFRVRVHVAEAIRVALTEKGSSSHKRKEPRDLSFAEETVDGKLTFRSPSLQKAKP
jgi:hypothetical protein